jgi:hypothetical protein
VPLIRTAPRWTRAAKQQKRAFEIPIRASIEIGRGVCVNVVSPGWIAETKKALGMDASGALTAAEVAKFYVRSLEGGGTGQVIVADR